MPREGAAGMDMTALRQIDFETARRIAEEKGLRPAKVKGTATLRFSKADNEPSPA